MEQRTSTLRLRRVRFKDGRAPIEVIPQRTPQQDRRDVEGYVREVLDGHEGRISGFAIVVWGPNTASTAEVREWLGAVPHALVPDFVRERIWHEINERWTRQGLREDGVIA